MSQSAPNGSYVYERTISGGFDYGPNQTRMAGFFCPRIRSTVEFLYLEVRGTFVKTSSYRKFDV